MRGWVSALRFSDVGSEFKSTCGEDVYTMRSGPFVAATMAKLKAYCVVINPFDPTCLNDILHNALLAKLVPVTPFIYLFFDVAFSQSGSFLLPFSDFPHLHLLHRFLSSLSVSALSTAPLVCLISRSPHPQRAPPAVS